MILPNIEGFIEMLEMLTSHIDSGSVLDPFSLKRIVASSEKIPDYPIKMMTLGLAYGAAQEHEIAIEYFKKAVEVDDDIVMRNYLSYLSHSGHYELYREECVRLARRVSTLPMLIRARNASYSDGNGELSLFFARKALTMIGDDAERKFMEEEVKMKNANLENFINASSLSTQEISMLTRAVANVAKSHDVLAVSNEYYTSSDGDAAVICDVICKDADVLADMDIQVATELAVSDIFSEKNVTAWFRGRDRNEVTSIA